MSNHGYLLIFRGTDWYQGLSPEPMQQVADNWMAWFNRLKGEGTALAGNPLEPQGKIVSGKNRVVSDGPFAESKETIGGYFLLKVNTLDAAVVIAQQCPGLPLASGWKSGPLRQNVRCSRKCNRKHTSRTPDQLNAQLPTKN